ncbi:MAG: hypothetical protein KDA63_05925, partial [Planctomycetales bacterium]|nr:hypothetical protein [Planctomycetales bacterium]
GSVTLGDVINMSKAGVDDQLIANHIRANGYAGPLTSNDLITLQQQGVGTTVVEAIQQSPRPQVVAAVPAAPVPVVVEEFYYPPPIWGPVCYPPRHYHHGPNVSWGVSVSN